MLPATHQIPGLEKLKKEAELRAQAERRQKREALGALGIDEDLLHGTDSDSYEDSEDQNDIKNHPLKQELEALDWV